MLKKKKEFGRENSCLRFLERQVRNCLFRTCTVSSSWLVFICVF